MKQPEYHGIILDLEFKDPKYPLKFDIFATRKSTENNWLLYGIRVSNDDLEEVISAVQENLKDDKPYYAHFYNDEELVVVYKMKVFRVKPHKSTWKQIIEYGRKLEITEDQLTFWPNRFQDEEHYFKEEDFL